MKIIPNISVKMTIKDISYISYLVPAQRIRTLVPDILPIAIVDNNKVFISVVIFHCIDIRLENLPSLHFSYDQINIRTYVMEPSTGGHGVYFFRSGITSSAATYFTRLLRLPWESIHFSVIANRDENECYTSYTVSGHWNGDIYIEMEEDPQIKNIHPFKSPDEAIHYFTEPLIGFYSASGNTYRVEVKHTEILPCSGKVKEIRFPFLSTLGILEESEIHQPSNILLARQGYFRVFLPHHRIK